MGTHTVTRRNVVKGLCLGGAGAVLGMPAIVRANPRTVIRAAHVEVAGGGTNQSLLYMADLVAKRSNGEIKIEAYPDGVLSGGSGQVGIDQLVAGAVQMVPTTTAYFSSLEPKLSIYSLPFAFASYEEYEKALRGPLGAKLAQSMPAKNIVVSGWWPRAFRQLWASKQVKTPADLVNVRIRIMDNPLYVETFKQLGARPVPMAWGEVYTALQLKAIDAVEPDISAGYLTKMYEVCKFLTTWNYSIDALMVAYNKTFWDSLSADTRDLLTQAASDTVDFKRELEQKLEDEARAGLAQAGVTIGDLTAEEHAVFKDAVQPVWSEYEPTFGTDLISLLRG